MKRRVSDRGGLFHRIRGWTPWDATRVEAVPYTALAAVYDRLMAHVDYEAWATYVDHFFLRFGNGGKRLLDAGCGTGRLLASLQRRGYRVFGLDRSFAMLKQGQGRIGPFLWQGDIRRFAVGKPVDGVLSLYDTLQYLRPEELPSFLACAWAALEEGGLLMFDVVTEGFLIRYWADLVEWDRFGPIAYHRESRFDESNRVLITEIRLRNRKTHQEVIERHIQWSFKLADIQKRVEASGFSPVGCFDGFSFEPGSETSERVHFLFRKRCSEGRFLRSGHPSVRAERWQTP